jgi:trimethylamine--corrinoid protein Co-methyltransferase
MAASEKWSSAFLPALAGANINAGAGSLACISTISLEQLAIDDDIYGRLFRQLRGFTLDEETLAAEVIARAGYDASFLGDLHTLAHFRSEYSYSELANRENAPHWEATGSKEVLQRATEEVQRLLSEWQPVISENQERELSAVVTHAEKALQDTELPV